MISRRALLAGAAGLIASPAIADFPVITGAPRKLDQMLRRAGVWSNCALALDAGDARSYATGQTWTDISPNARNFLRGADSTSSTDDPTFNGTAGALTAREYFSVDGADFFTKASANDAYFNNLHKDNAVFSLAMLVWFGATASSQVLFSTFDGTGASHGVHLVTGGTAQILFSQGNNTANTTIKTSTATISSGSWTFIGLSVNEAGGASGSFMQLGTAVETFNGAYTSPSSSNANLARLLSRAGSTNYLASGGRLMFFTMFDSAITQTQMNDLRTYMRRRVV